VSRTDLLCLGLIFLGVFLFLYGAKYYDEFAGWTGVVLFVGGIVALFVFYFYNWYLSRKNQKA
jgi:NADH:ubiquinone oxidoreductase subunit 6 (subunit J)